jgi:hypothetical protein
VKGVPRVFHVFRGISTLADVWKFHPIIRGRIIESFLAQTKYTAAGGWDRVGRLQRGFYKAFDFAQTATQTLVSMKSTQAGSATWVERLKSHMADMVARAKEVAPGANLVLDVQVQGGAVQTYAKEIAELKKFGLNNGNITVKVSEFN